MMNLFDLIREDHRSVEDIVAQLENTTDDEVTLRGHLLGELRDELIPHMRAEESVFYAPLKNSESAIDMIHEAEEEHQEMDELLDELQAIHPGDPEWIARLDLLKETLDGHIQEEEDEYFEIARSEFSAQQIEGMLDRMREEKERHRRDIERAA